MEVGSSDPTLVFLWVGHRWKFPAQHDCASPPTSLLHPYSSSFIYASILIHLCPHHFLSILLYLLLNLPDADSFLIITHLSFHLHWCRYMLFLSYCMSNADLIINHRLWFHPYPPPFTSSCISESTILVVLHLCRISSAILFIVQFLFCHHLHCTKYWHGHEFDLQGGTPLTSLQYPRHYTKKYISLPP